MFKIEDAPRELSFGRCGEHGEQYEFDFSAWAAELPGGGPGVTVILPYTSDVVTLGAAQAVVDGTTLTVKIENNLTLTAGRGTMVIRYVVDGHEKRSRVIDFTVEESHAPSTGDAPDPVTDWVSDATAKLAEVDPALGLAAEATLAANTAAGRADTIVGTLEGIAPKWAAVDISASGLAAGAAPTASVTQDVGGTHLTVGIPKGDKGDKGDTGNVMYATFDIDFDTGELVMTIPDGYTGPTFSINDETGELEVSI